MSNREVMQQALDALVQLDGLDTETECVTIDVGDVIAALKAALEQQAEPPPEWPLIKNILAVFGLDAISFVAKWQAAQQQAEPVAYFDFQELKFTWAKHMKIGPVPVSIKVEPMKLYLEAPQQQAEPPQRQWVGLEIEEVQDSYNSDYQAQTRAVEKLLKERNG